VRPSAKQVAVVAVVIIITNEKADDFNNIDVNSSSKCSTTSTSHDEPVHDIDLSEDCSSDNEDSSVVGTCGAFAGDGDADVPVQSKPPRTTELPSSTVPCAQPSQGCRARPFLARKAKEGLKRYI